jgi:hypothetical protein
MYERWQDPAGKLMDLPPVELVRTKNNHTQITSSAMHLLELPSRFPAYETW